MSDFYDVSGAPGQGGSLSSATIRGEFALIEAAFGKLPTLTGNGSKLVQVNSGGTALEAVSSLTGKTFTSACVITGTDNSKAMLRVTQLGTANALEVEDSTNPDATPFIITATGKVVNGHTSNITAECTHEQVNGRIGVYAFNESTFHYPMEFYKSRTTTIGSHTVVQDGDILVHIRGHGSDGTGFIVGAELRMSVDGTPGTNSMPTRVSLRTTASGASSTTERLRADSKGNVIVGTAQLANDATDGFFYIPGTTSGAPSGSPTAYSGRHPMVLDDTNNRLYIHNGSAWKYAALS